jgi:hypothetical protein
MYDKQRAAGRKRIDQQVTGEVTVYQPMSVLDVSEHGIQVETAVPLQNDSLHDFRIPLGDHAVVLKGRVAYCHVGHLEDGSIHYRSGIEFIEPPPHALSVIRDFLADRDAQPPKVVDGEVE